MTPFLSKQSISVHVRVMIVDVITLAEGTPGQPEGTINNFNNNFTVFFDYIVKLTSFITSANCCSSVC